MAATARRALRVERLGSELGAIAARVRAELRVAQEEEGLEFGSTPPQRLERRNLLQRQCSLGGSGGPCCSIGEGITSPPSLGAPSHPPSPSNATQAGVAADTLRGRRRCRCRHRNRLPWRPWRRRRR